MERKILLTEDGSHTVSIPQLKVSYHSIHGAIQESRHVFIDAGLKPLFDSAPQPVHVFEMGLGTGLNAFLTAIEAEARKIKIRYTAIEPFPLSITEVKALNYAEQLLHEELFHKIHRGNWNEELIISEYFLLKKENTSLGDFACNKQFDLIYYDAFAPSAQPELWTKEIFQKLSGLLKPSGILVTYCSKGDVRRAMLAAGFTVKKLPGPPGKREIVRAIKT